MLRRHFLRALAAPFILPFLPAGLAQAREDATTIHRIDGASRRLADLLQTPSARVIGARALACGACEPDADRLAASLVESFPVVPGPTGSDDLRRLVDQRIRDDFAESRTVVIDGWVLSRTEVRLCALRTVIPA
jgi:hypothetical protein